MDADVLDKIALNLPGVIGKAVSAANVIVCLAGSMEVIGIGDAVQSWPAQMKTWASA